MVTEAVTRPIDETVNNFIPKFRSDSALRILMALHLQVSVLCKSLY